MTQWWEIDTPQLPGAVPKFRAVAYYRHSAQDRQENSIPIQLLDALDRGIISCGRQPNCWEPFPQDRRGTQCHRHSETALPAAVLSVSSVCPRSCWTGPCGSAAADL